MTMKSSGCGHPYCDEVNCTAVPSTRTWNFKAGESGYTSITDDRQKDDVVPPMLKSFQKNPFRHIELSKRVASITKELKAIQEKLWIAKGGEKKRLIGELEDKNAEYAKLKDLMLRTAETGGWLGVPDEELFALIEKAKQKDPERVEALECRAFTAVAEFTAIGKKRAATSNEAKQARLSMLMGRKEIEFDEAMNAIAVIADSCEQEEINETNDVSDQEDYEELDDSSEQKESKE